MTIKFVFTKSMTVCEFLAAVGQETFQQVVLAIREEREGGARYREIDEEFNLPLRSCRLFNGDRAKLILNAAPELNIVA